MSFLIDGQVSSPGEETLFGKDNNYRINDTGAATLKLAKKAKTVTIRLRRGVKWSDGKPVTAKDMEYSYEIMANKKTKSERSTSQFEYIKGMKEYHEGKANLFWTFPTNKINSWPVCNLDA